MHNGNFFEWLGSLIGAVIRGVVHALNFVVGGFGHALGEFTGGLTGALGIRSSVLNIALLILGLFLLFTGVRAFRARSYVAGVLWTVFAALLLGKLVAH
jgi:hypothetical protein